jgi:hypothetical protein
MHSVTGFESKRAQARDKLQGESMSDGLKLVIDQYSDLLIQVLEIKGADNQKVLADVLFSIADTDALIDQGLLR